MGDLLTEFMEIANLLGLQPWKPSLYSLRHGGASQDLRRGIRDLSDKNDEGGGKPTRRSSVTQRKPC
eukprot:793294-Karenia_brevis.AAC.1